jgi:hypothetical protein
MYFKIPYDFTILRSEFGLHVPCRVKIAILTTLNPTTEENNTSNVETRCNTKQNPRAHQLAAARKNHACLNFTIRTREENKWHEDEKPQQRNKTMHETSTMGRELLPSEDKSAKECL